MQGCNTVDSGGGFTAKDFSTVSLVGTLVAECFITGTDSESRGGGIYVEDATLNMTGGAILDCDSYNGGGLAVKGAGSQAHLSGVAVQSCNAYTHGAGIYIESGYVTLVDVGIEDCVVRTNHGGGVAVFQQKYAATVRADRVRVARCHSLTHEGGAVYLEGGTGTWTDCSFSDCTSQKGNVQVYRGTQTLIRCSIMRCRALGVGARIGRGGALHLQSGNVMVVDSIIIGCSARDAGGCIGLTDGSAILRNTTLSSCSAPDGPYISLETASAAIGFVSELLTLEPACEEVHSGALITVTDEFHAPLTVRGLQVHACASSSLSVLSGHVRLASCSDGGVCGDAASCADVVPLPSAPNLTTVNCSCEGEFFPNPAGTSLALAPYGFDPSSIGLPGPSIDYCVGWCRLKSAQRQICYSNAFAPRCRAGHAARRRQDHAQRLRCRDRDKAFQDHLGPRCLLSRPRD